MPKSGVSSSRTRMLPTANWPADIAPAMITCGPEMFQLFRIGGGGTPSSSEDAITLIRRPGRARQTSNVSAGKMPVPPMTRPSPSGPRARTMNPPITAVGTNRARSCGDQRRMRAAPANTSDRITSARPIASGVNCIWAGLRQRPAPRRPVRGRGGLFGGLVDAEDVAPGVGEHEAPAARVVMELRRDPAAGVEDAGQGFVSVRRVHKGQDAVAAGRRRVRIQSAELPAGVPGVPDPRVLAPVIGELPAQRLRIEGRCLLKIVDGEFDVVDHVGHA